MKKLALLLGIALAGCGQESAQTQPVVEQKVEFPADNKGTARRKDYIVETDFEKGTMRFYQNGDRRNFPAMFTTRIPGTKDPERAREYAAAITYSLDRLITRGRNTAHKEQLREAKRPEYTGKEIIETYFQRLDGLDGSLDGTLSAEELNPEKLNRWEKMSDSEFRQKFPLCIDTEANPLEYGGIREKTLEECDFNDAEFLNKARARIRAYNEKVDAMNAYEKAKLDREWAAKEAAAQYGR